jgi:hypothetical protein
MKAPEGGVRGILSLNVERLLGVIPQSELEDEWPRFHCGQDLDTKRKRILLAGRRALMRQGESNCQERRSKREHHASSI